MIPDNYIVNQNPMKFGGRQSDYVQRSEEVIQWGLKLISSHPKESENYKALFTTIMEGFAKVRHELAISHGTVDAKYFGRSRMFSMGDVEITGLSKEYKGFNNSLLSLFSTLLKGRIPLQGELTPQQKKLTVEDIFLGRKCALEIELISQEEAIRRKFLMPTAEMIRDQQDARQNLPPVKMVDYDENNYPPTDKEMEMYESFNRYMQTMKQKNPELYTRSKIWYVLKRLSEAFPLPTPIFNDQKCLVGLKGNIDNMKSIYAIGTVRIQFGNKMYALSKYITWACRDGVTDPADRMLNTVGVILHQDRFLLNDSIDEIAKIFKKAIEWDRSQDLQVLKNDVGLIRYLFAHAMPFSRGSAAIGEWIEKLVYRVHNYDCVHSAKTLGDMEAFIAPLWSTFQKKIYETTFALVDRGA